ncbi:uncharacterized protein LOC107806947 [Nicotiana tabacum]|uniref:Uncharacterized protein LOC107806947 n=1 Tax=Nicotiana tabacum TaxID=4097 RepID=A0AC58TQ89_TOBAC
MVWFVEGYRNTSFFHNHVNGKRKNFQLKRIQTGSGMWIEDQDQLANAAVDFYERQLLMKNLELSIFPSIEEVMASIFELSGESASGPGRLKKFLPYLISPNKSGFVKGRSIFENILLTQEIVTDMRLRGKPANVHFINMVWNWVSNNWYLVLVNGQSSGFFKFTRGVKKGDPLSPALFILSAELLSRLLNKLFEDKSFIGFGMPKWSEHLNHLAYDDDTIIFASAHCLSLRKITVVLGKYEKISGQMISKPKSSYYIYSKVAHGLFQAVGDSTGFPRDSFKVQRKKVGVIIGHLGRIFVSLKRRVARTTKSLWSNFMWNKYCMKELPTVVQFRKGSKVWKQILNAREEVEHDILWEMKSGTTNVWHENWTGLGALYHVLPEDFPINEDLQEAAQLRQEEAWNDQLFDQSFTEEITNHIRSSVQYEGSEDYWDGQYWMPIPVRQV